MQNDSLEKLISDPSFVRWVKGESTTEEKARWEVWLHKDPHHQLLREEAEAMITASEEAYEVPDPLAELKKLDGAIEEYEKKQHKAEAGKSKPFLQVYRGAIAAGLLFLVTALGGYLAYQNNLLQTSPEKAQTHQISRQYTTAYGETATFNLSDGSRIILNAHSSLKFSSKTGNGLDTEVWLKGEAYFDIAHLEDEQQRTFTVHTKAGSIQVLGTRFVVKTIGSNTRTVLEEGKISIKVSENGQSSSEPYVLRPGKMARFKAGGNTVAIDEVNTQIYTSWINNEWFFENTPMVDVARRLEDTFGVKVAMGKKYATMHLTGSIKSTNLDVISDALEAILDTAVKQEGQHLIIGANQ